MARKQLDGHFKKLNLFRMQVSRTPEALFKSASTHLFHTQAFHLPISQRVNDFIRKAYWLFEPLLNGEEDVNSYLRKTVEFWPGLIEIKALSHIYGIRFVIFSDVNQPPTSVCESEEVQGTVNLAAYSHNRYDLVYSRDDIAIYSICQSIIYELLYKEVFGLGEDVDMAVVKMLHDKNYSKQRKQIQAEGHDEPHLLFDVDEEPETVVKKALAQGIPPFPYKIAKNLDPYIYRNVEFDIWNEERKSQLEEQYTPPLAPGVKCWLVNKNNNKCYVTYIQELLPNEKANVYIESGVGEKRVVDISSLEPIAIPMAQAYFSKYHVGFRKEVPYIEKRNKRFNKKQDKNGNDYMIQATPIQQEPFMNHDSGYGTRENGFSSRKPRKNSESGHKDCGSYVKQYNRPRSYSDNYATVPKMLEFSKNDYNSTPSSSPSTAYDDEVLGTSPTYFEQPNGTLFQNAIYHPTYSASVSTNIYPMDYPEQGSFNSVSLPVDIPNMSTYITEPNYPEASLNPYVTESNTTPYLLYPTAPLPIEPQNPPITIPTAMAASSYYFNTPPHSGLSPSWITFPPSNGISSCSLPTMPIYQQRCSVTPVVNAYTAFSVSSSSWIPPPTNFHPQVISEMNPGYMVPVTQMAYSAPCVGIPPTPGPQFFSYPYQGPFSDVPL